MTPPKNYGIVASLEELDQWVAKLQVAVDEGKPIGFDVETGYHGPDHPKRALDHDRNFIVGFSFTTDTTWARYVPIAHDMGPNLDPDEVWVRFKPILENGYIICHNVKFETRALRRVGIKLGIGHKTGVGSDSMLEVFLLSEVGDVNVSGVGLKFYVKKVFGHEMLTLADLFPGITKKQLECIRFNVLDLSPQVIHYACEDALWCLAAHQRNHQRVKDMLLYVVEHEAMQILTDMEDWGVRIDWDFLRTLAGRAELFLKKIEREILAEMSAATGEQVMINLHSPPALQKILFEKLGLKTTRKTKAGKMSTDKVALEGLRKKVPIVAKLLAFREIEALHKRYFDKWPREFSGNPRDGRAHPEINQVIVGTGRFAVNNPPLQQCPKKFRFALGVDAKDWTDKANKELWEAIPEVDRFEGNFRDCIVADEGHYLLDFDYSQIELRVLAGLSQEPALLDAFDNDKDVHTITASMMLGVPVAEISEEQRAIGKTMNFALLYGMGVRSLADRLGISSDRAAELYAAYFAGFPSITAWMEKMKEEGKARGYTTSRFGRRYTIWELQSSNMAIYSKGERVCINAPVQGGAADYKKVAMVRAKKALVKQGLWGTVRLIMDNHDALTFEVPDHITPHALVEILRPAVEFKVDGFPKIVADFSYGQRWGSMKKLDGATKEDESPDLDEDGLPVLHVDVEAAVAQKTEPASVTKQDMAAAQTAVENGAIDTVPAEGQSIIVEIDHMPTPDQFRSFMSFCAARPGPNSTVIRTPEGELMLNSGTSLSLEMQPQVSMLLSGASIRYPASAASVSALAQDLEL